MPPKRICHALPFLVLGLSLAGPSVLCASEPVGEIVGMLPSELDEASGMACSLRNPGLWWLNNDSGAKPKLHAIFPDGRYQGSLQVRDCEAVDWEDCTSFLHEGKPCLLIADVGDNTATRSQVTLIVVAEPAASALSPERKLMVDSLWRVTLVFPDGPRDCEAVAVDAQGERVLLLSKRTRPPVLYSVPLRPSTTGPVTAQRLVSLDWLRPTDAKQPKYGGQPTALSISADGWHAALLTYDGLWIFDRKPGQSWEQCLGQPGRRFSLGLLPQAEAAAMDATGRTLLVTTEGRIAPILRFSPAK